MLLVARVGLIYVRLVGIIVHYNAINRSKLEHIFKELVTYYHHHHHHHPLSLLHSSLAGSQKSTGLSDQEFLIHCSAQNFLTTGQALLLKLLLLLLLCET
jgi:hypothetical protein